VRRFPNRRHRVWLEPVRASPSIFNKCIIISEIVKSFCVCCHRDGNVTLDRSRWSPPPVVPLGDTSSSPRARVAGVADGRCGGFRKTGLGDLVRTRVTAVALGGRRYVIRGCLRVADVLCARVVVRMRRRSPWLSVIWLHADCCFVCRRSDISILSGKNMWYRL
jgi:hypothetical protein